MAVDGVGGLTVGGDRFDGVDGHPVDGGIEVGDPEPNGAADADEWNESAHAPVEELARTDPEVFAGFVFGEQAIDVGVGLSLHDINSRRVNEAVGFVQDGSQCVMANGVCLLVHAMGPVSTELVLSYVTYSHFRTGGPHWLLEASDSTHGREWRDSQGAAQSGRPLGHTGLKAGPSMDCVSS